MCFLYLLQIDDYLDNCYDCKGTCDEEEEFLQNFYFLPVLYSIIFVLGLFGNGLMIAVLLRRRRRLRITEIYLLHLAVADLLLIFTLPFSSVSNLAGWMFGSFFCMLNGTLENLNLLCGSLLLACIGFDRYLAIVHAVPSMQSRRPIVVHLMCASLWVLCLILALPNAVFLSVVQYDSYTPPDCYYHRFDIHSHNWVIANRIIHHVCFFFSFGVMCYCYTMLAITLFHSQKSHAKKGAIRLALLLTLVFCFCWLPFNVASVFKTYEELRIATQNVCESVVLSQVYYATRCLGMSHCCLNPFLYAFVGMQFRNELVQLVCQLGCCRVWLLYNRASIHARPFVSEATTTNSTYI